MSLVLVCGSRNWTDESTIADVLSDVFYEVEEAGGQPKVMHGNAPGADTLAAKVSDFYGVPTLVFPADWKRHGKAAGPIRNRQMLDEKPELVIAFHLGESRGTRDCVNEAMRRGIRTLVISADGDDA